MSSPAASLLPSASAAASTLEHADVAVAATLAQERHSPAIRGVGALSDVGDQLPLFCLGSVVVGYGLAKADRRATLAGAQMLGSLLLATMVKAAVKRSISRTRPHMLLDRGHYEVRPFGPDEGPWHSFPSGHTAGSVAVARAVARSYPQARWAAYTGAAAIALIQVPRGAHYPIDVLAGAAVGLAAEAVVNAASSKAIDAMALRALSPSY